jgi:hypothetical protein
MKDRLMQRSVFNTQRQHKPNSANQNAVPMCSHRLNRLASFRDIADGTTAYDLPFSGFYPAKPQLHSLHA